MHKHKLISLACIVASLASCTSLGGENILPSPSIASAPSSTPTPGLLSSPTQETADSLDVGTVPPGSPTPQPPHPKLCSPLAEHPLEQLPEIVSQPYAPPPPGRDERHHGVDFAYYRHEGRASIAGEGVQAIMAGRVAAAIQDRLPYGNMVIIETPYENIPPGVLAAIEIPKGSSLYHLYAHFAETPLIALDQQVECGQLLGYVGRTGYNVPVAHLHLETRLGPPGASFESMVFYDAQATPKEQAAYVRWRTSGEFQHFDPMEILIGR